VATAEARVNFTNFTIQRWISAHSDTYIPVMEQTAAATPSEPGVASESFSTTGKQMTLMNAAFMIRQVIAHHPQTAGVISKLTSLTHLSPEATPDGWEKTALLAFKNGGREVLDISRIDGEPYLRLMRPIPAESQCLSCHGGGIEPFAQNLGGASISVPMQPYWESWHKQVFKAVISFALLWLIGLAGLSLFYHRFSKKLDEREKA